MKKYFHCVCTMLVVFAVVSIIIAGCIRGYMKKCYKDAHIALTDENYEEAREGYEKLGVYKDSKIYLRLLDGIDRVVEKRYSDARNVFSEISDSESVSAELRDEAKNWGKRAQYLYGQQLFCDAKYEDAKEEFTKLGEYEDAKNWIKRSDLEYGKLLYNQKSYELAMGVFESLGNYNNATSWLKAAKFEYARQLYNSQKWKEAIQLFRELGMYEGAEGWLKKTKFEYGKYLYEKKEYSDAIEVLKEIDQFEASEDLLKEVKYVYALELYGQGKTEDALSLFLDLGEYGESEEFVDKLLGMDITFSPELLYKAACHHFETGSYWRALREFKEVSDYKDSLDYMNEAKMILRKQLARTVSVGLSYTVAVTKNNRVVITGQEYTGRTGFAYKNVNGDDWMDVASVSGFGTTTIGLKGDGKVVVATNNKDILRKTSDWKDMVAISAGYDYVIGLKSNGTLVGAGHDSGDGQCNVTTWRNIVGIATGWRHTVGIDKYGEIYITGHGADFQLNEIKASKDDWDNIVAIAAGGGGGEKAAREGHTVGLREDGRVVAVGDDTFNQCSGVKDWEHIVAIAAGDWFTAGLCDDGSIVITEPSPEIIDQYGLYVDGLFRVKDWTNTSSSRLISISAGGGSLVGLFEDGSVVAFGYNGDNQSSDAENWEDIMVY